MTKLKPPSISIVGIPVMQTTWSLRLPSGYRYLRPGGNMSPVAGTVEMLSFGIEAKLEQLQRLEKTYRDVAGASSRRQQVVADNWRFFNGRLAAEIGQAESFLAQRRHEVGEEEYARLRSKLAGQRQRQDMLLGKNSVFIQQQQEQAGRDLNLYLNLNADNAGVAEITRNQFLWEKPDFLSKSEEQQIARLQEELEVSQRQLDLFEGKDVSFDVTFAPKDEIAGIAGKKAGEIVGDLADKKKEMNQALEQIARQNAAQIDQKQSQIRKQLEGLLDNRAQRYFKADAQKAMGPRSQVELQVQQPAPQLEAADEYDADYAYRDSNRRRGTSVRRQDQMAVPGAAFGRVARPSIAGQSSAPAAVSVGESIYTAKGTYSLPVSLPEGEIRLDFSRPAGEAELSVWAVSQGTVRNLYGTIILIMGLLIIAGLAKIWPRPQIKQPTSGKRIFVYILMLIVLTLVLGLAGFIMSLVVILYSEARRGAFVRPATVEV